MKKFAVLFLFFSIIMISFSSCHKIIGDGPVVTETRTTREFSEIDFGVPGEMIFIESDENEIEIEAQRNIVDVIETYVSGDELKIRVRNSANIRSSEIIRITVKSRNVRSLAVSGSGSLKVPGIFEADQAKLRVSGSGNMTITELKAGSVQSRISGSGSIEVLDGAADDEDISISGSGNIDLLGVNAEKATTQTSGSGNIKVNVSGDLDVRISGSGDVFYEGNPQINVSVSGSGRLVKL